MGFTDGVAMHFTLFCRNDRGRLWRSKLVDAATRGALLCDLAFADRLTDTPDGLEIDPEPTGFAPADKLLAAIVANPGRSLVDWLKAGPGSQPDLVAELVRSGEWTRQHVPLTRARSYDDRLGRHRESEQVRLRRAVATGIEPVQATAGLLAQAAALAPDDIAIGLDRSGPVSWLLDSVLDHLDELRERMERYRFLGDGTGTMGT